MTAASDIPPNIRSWPKVLVSIWLLGALFLVWGLLSLHKIFSEERISAIFTIQSKHKTLEQYALQNLHQALQQKLALAKIELGHVLQDPLLANNEILYFDDKEQLLPRITSYKESQPGENRALKIYNELMDAEPIDLIIESVKPWDIRLSLLSNFKLAVESSDANDIRWAFREISEQRAREALPGDVDIPYFLAVLDYLLTFSNPKKTLVQNSIRNGSITEKEQGRYGLQRLMLKEQKLFSKVEFDFLKDKIVSISKIFSIPYIDFLKQTQSLNPTLDLNPNLITSPALLLNATWYVEPQSNSHLLGTAINIDELIENTNAIMKKIGLLNKNESLNLSSINRKVLKFDEVSINVVSPGLSGRLKAVHNLYWIKTFLLFISAILVAGIAMLMIIFQHRKQRLLSQKADFIATVSHELKTPLTSIRLLAETLMRRTMDRKSVKEYPNRIIKTIDGMSLLVDNILSFNRINKEAWQLKKSHFFIEEIVSSLRSEFTHYSNLPIHIKMKNLDDFEIYADQELIKILVRNLVNNACKYNDKNEVKISIEGQNNSADILYFSDNGVGIEEHNWKTVFDEFTRFVQTQSKTISGTGLGLAICKKIMNLHLGDIHIVKSNNAGTTFKLVFST